MELKRLSDSDLLKNTLLLAHKERETTLEVLRHLHEVERRSLFATLAYPSLFEYAVKELKYSASAAQRRIMSMRLMKEVPQIEKKVERGELSLSTLAQAQSFFRQEKMNPNGQIKSTADKIEVLKCLENKSSREVERELVSRCAEPQKLIPEKLRAVSAHHTEIKFLIEENLLKEIEELRALLSHKLPGASVKEVLAYAVKATVKNLKPKEPKTKLLKDLKKSPQGANHESSRKPEQRAALPAQKVAPANTSRYIPVETKRAVWKRDGGQCSFVNTVTKKRCCSKHSLELDHIHPHALGGGQTTENLRLRCRAHNQLAAVQSFGQNKMSAYVPRMR